MTTTEFPNYIELRERHPITAKQWRIVRLVSVSATLGICALLVLKPDIGLFLFWGVGIPLLPLLFFLAPGVWRNICPLASLNQTPRVFNFTRGATAPPWLIRYGHLIGFTLFITLVSLRKVVFNDNGPAVAVLILTLLVGAFVGGMFLKGKSGWCSTICPLLPVQRLYGQTPFAVIPNSHCNPCVGCAKNCYDFNPKVAYTADQYDDETKWATRRRFIAAVFPGLVLGFYLVPDPPAISVVEMYARLGLFMAGSAALFFTLDSIVETTPMRLTTLFGAAALNLFYWFTAPRLFDGLDARIGLPGADVLTWGFRAAVFGLSAWWMVRTYRRERAYQKEVMGVSARVETESLEAIKLVHQGDPEVTFTPDLKHVIVDRGDTLLEIAEQSHVAIEAGCRMGVCGSDPVAITDGAANLSPISDDEKKTLERLGLAPNARMACSARVHGSVTVSLQVEKGPTVVTEPFDIDPDIKSVVVIGNGIAGVTTVDHIRRRHPDCEVHLVGREKHHFYNRMAISRLIYGRSAMQGLFLLSDEWYEEHNISCWLNTQAISIDTTARAVHLGTGDVLQYDRLVLTTGARSFVPAIEGWPAKGGFVLRDAEDAMEIRAFAQRPTCREAIVAGGGLLGLEAAYALLKLNLRVTVLERAGWLLQRQLDQTSAQFLRARLEDVGLHILTNAEVALISTGEMAESVTLKDGRHMIAQIVLVAAGVAPDVDLAREAGLEVGRGVVVDDHLRTSDPNIYAAGDVAEFENSVSGLWPAAVEQAEIVAHNVAGGDRTYRPSAPVTMLKVVGIDLTSMGRFSTSAPGDREIVVADELDRRYRKIVLEDGYAVGGILLGHPEFSVGLSAAVRERRDLSREADALASGDWTSLADPARVPLPTA